MNKSFIALCIFAHNTESGDKIENITLRGEAETELDFAISLQYENRHLDQFEIVEMKECEPEPEPALYAGFDEWLNETNVSQEDPFRNE